MATKKTSACVILRWETSDPETKNRNVETVATFFREADGYLEEVGPSIVDAIEQASGPEGMVLSLLRERSKGSDARPLYLLGADASIALRGTISRVYLVTRWFDPRGDRRRWTVEHFWKREGDGDVWSLWNSHMYDDVDELDAEIGDRNMREAIEAEEAKNAEDATPPDLITSTYELVEAAKAIHDVAEKVADVRLTAPKLVVRDALQKAEMAAILAEQTEETAEKRIATLEASLRRMLAIPIAVSESDANRVIGEFRSIAKVALANSRPS